MVATQGRETTAKAQQKTEDQATEPQQESDLYSRIEALLTQLPVPVAPPAIQAPVASRMTPEAQAALAAPLDPKFIKERKGDNGKMYSYADLDYLEARAREVDPEWSSHISGGGPNVVICTITILGVPHSATAGYYIGEEYEVWDYKQNAMVSKPMTSRVAHTIVGAAEAASERRAFAKHRLGEELWKKDQDSEDHAPASESRTSSSGKAQSRGGEFRAPSDGRLKMLNDLGVPTAVAKLINSWSRGKGDDGFPISDVSETIKALLDARGRDKGPIARRVWEPIVAEHAPYALSSNTESTDDEDDDWTRD